MCQKNDCTTCYWFEDGNSDFWCGYYQAPFESLEPCDKFVDAVEFTATHSINIGQGGKVTIVPNAGEEEYFNNIGRIV